MAEVGRTIKDKTGSLRAAVDVGGTFTDFVLLEDEQVVSTAKVLTTPADPSVAIADGLEILLADYSRPSLSEVVHGTTLVANALIERKGAKTVLITTEGFRDVLASGREQRYDLYDLFLELPEPLVPRRRRMTVRERVLADGKIDVPLDEDAVRAIAANLSSDVESVAICFLHSYRDSKHEKRAAEIVGSVDANISLSLSCEVSPEIGEYERVSTTVANAFVRPVVDKYLETLEDRLTRSSISAPLRIMLSTGGLASTTVARRFPVRLLESGPAAGVLAAGYLGHASEDRPILAFDMGGTTAKAALLEDGQPLLARKMEAARVYRFKKGSGLPIRIPVIDLIEIGAGGGSIARVGEFGLPKVGPDSASSVPGPVAYGQGGQNPTVTDADLVLGYLNPKFFLGGTMALDLPAAKSALSELGSEMGLGLFEAAAAVHSVVNENMASAARIHAIEIGRDIRKYALVATGGAGPVHAWGVARVLGISRLIFPPRAGVASAFGMLSAPTAFDFARSIPSLVSEIDWEVVGAALTEMRSEGQQQLDRSGAAAGTVRIAADVRYTGQGEAITVDLGESLGTQPEAQVLDGFHTAYETLYGALPSHVEPELLTWRLRVSGPRPAPIIGLNEGQSDRDPLKGHREAWEFESKEFRETPVYDRYALPPTYEFEGPALVEERESTIVIGKGGTARVNDDGNVEVFLGA